MKLSHTPYCVGHLAMCTELKLLNFKDGLLFYVHEECLPILFNAKTYGEQGIKSQYFSLQQTVKKINFVFS